MRLHRFYIPEEIGSKTELAIHSPELVHQIKNVFRLKVGDSIIVFNGTCFDYLCKIDKFGEPTIIGGNSDSDDGRTLLLTKLSSRRSAFSSARKVFLCAAVVKKDTFEWIVEKATELGVTNIIPVMAERSEKKTLNEERLRKIAIEASEQSGRGDVPEISPIVSLEDAIKSFQQGPTSSATSSATVAVKLVAFHTEGGTRSDLVQKDQPVTLFIGPEGGWSPDEIEVFHKNNIEVVCLGKQILRAETAVVAALSLIVFNS
jgi:16S rRNA (uracil1498-N3)-methyltransferase